MTTRNYPARSHYLVRKSKLEDQIEDDNFSQLTVGQCIELAMQLSQDVWTLTGEKPNDGRLSRHIVRIYRSEG